MADILSGGGIVSRLPAWPSRRLADALLMLAAAVTLRCWWFGNPVIQVDEQFYLLVGDRMLHGLLPYVDIWDRKPIGLFLIYAAARLLGGEGIVEYQVVATLFAAAAAFFVVRIARVATGPVGARLAGLAALLWQIVFDGAGGQAPTFYNPLVAGAALLVLRATIEDRAPSLAARGAAAMALIGLAIQIKYTALFEGVGLGLLLLWRAWRNGWPLSRLAGCAGLWVGLAVAPTFAVYAVYVALGHGAAFAYANFVSISDRPSVSPWLLLDRLGTVAGYALPLVIAAVAGLSLSPPTRGGQRARRFTMVWLIAAGVGFVAIGSLYKHYFLPMVVPLSVAAAPALDAVFGRRRPLLRLVAPALIVSGLGLVLFTGLKRVHRRGSESEVAAIVAAIRPRLDGCLYVFDGEPILYLLTDGCLVSRYAFPNHLNERKEAQAIGVDPVAEVRRILIARPSIIVTSDRPAKDGNAATWATMRAGLRAFYRPVASFPVHHRLRIVYQRRAPPPARLAGRAGGGIA